MSSLAVLLAPGLAACGADPAPAAPPEEAVAPLELALSAVITWGYFASGSAVYLGDGLVLTNWHTVITSALADLHAGRTYGLSLPPSEHLAFYSVDGPPAAPGEVSVTDLYCFTSSTATTAARYERIPRQGAHVGQERQCLPVAEDVQVGLPLPAPGRVGWGASAELLYANRALDLAILRVSTASVAEAVGERPYRRLGHRRSLEAGQPVWLLGYPGSVRFRSPQLPVIELCFVSDPEVRLTADPDAENPSTLVVPSFRVNCASTAPGSSGSPVFDAATGEILGLAWTRDFLDYTYVTAASGWERYAGDQRGGDARHRPLEALFERD